MFLLESGGIELNTCFVDSLPCFYAQIPLKTG